MKVTGMNSASLAGALCEYSATTGSTTDKDSGSIENLLSSAMSANNTVLAGLAGKVENKSGYQKALKTVDQTNELLHSLTDAKKSVFVKAKEAQTDEEKDAYQTAAASEIAGFLSSYNSLITSLAETGGKTNKNFLSQLNELLGDYEKELEEAGVHIQADGTLALDAQTLAGTDLETLESLFGADAPLADALSGQLHTIAEETASTVDTLQIYSTAYSNSGSYSQYKYMKAIYDLQA